MVEVWVVTEWTFEALRLSEEIAFLSLAPDATFVVLTMVVLWYDDDDNDVDDGAEADEDAPDFPRLEKLWHKRNPKMSNRHMHALLCHFVF